MINLSIIIPHFNSVSSLDNLLQTIPNLKDIQVIIIDDNSDEKYKEELVKLKMKYSQRNIEFYNNDSKIKGAGACRNIGLKQASGKWLIFADADDYFLEDSFEVLKYYFTSNYDVVFFKPTSIEIDTGKLADRHQAYARLIDNYLNNKSLSTEIALRYSFHVPWSKLINANLVNKNNIYFDEVIASNDLMFSAKLGHCMKNFKVSKEIIYCVTRSRGSLTTTISHDVFDARLNVYIRYYNFLKNNLSKDKFKRLNVSGKSILIQSIDLGVRKVFDVYLKLKRNKVHLIDIKNFNPIRVVNRVFDIYYKKKKIKKYYKKVN